MARARPRRRRASKRGGPRTASPSRARRAYLRLLTAIFSCLPARNAGAIDALMVIISPVLGFRPCRDARLRASKLPKPVICTFAPFFSSPAMMPLSSNKASIVRVASALDILVRMASAAVSSALFTVAPCEGLGLENPCNYAPFRGGARENPHKTATIWGPPRKIRKIAALSRPTPPVRNPPPPRFHTPVARRQVASSYKVRVVRPTGWHWRPLLAWRLATPLAPSDLRTEGCPMFHGTRPGWIEVIAGVMFSGKSEELIRRVRRAVIGPQKGQGLKAPPRPPPARA